MRKSLIDPETASRGHAKSHKPSTWLNIEDLARVEITSEDALFPIEHALANGVSNGASNGWRASAKGPQFIRLNFDNPTPIQRIQLDFVEKTDERCQEFAIYARSEGSDNDNELREIVRQQFTFSPGGSTEESEDYTVALSGVTCLELRIDPDRAHDPTHSQHFATLQSLRIA